MKHLLSVFAGMAIGCLLMLLLKQPLLEPFDDNTTTVVAALSSTVLAVIGAFALWGYQFRARQHDFDKIVVPVFEPLYTALCQVRDLGRTDSAEKLLLTIRGAFPGAALEAPSRSEVVKYQDEAFPRAIDAAVVEAKTVLSHWTSLQDVLLGISPRIFPDILAIHRVASGAIDQLPRLRANSKPEYLDQVGPQMKPADIALLTWAIGRIANVLNKLDRGTRDDSGYMALEPGRAAAIKAWSATYGHQ